MRKSGNMFTGIVRHLGEVRSVAGRGQGARATVECPQPLLAEAETGDSIAVDGCCLTLTDRKDGCAVFDLSPETVGRTAALAAGQKVHLEASLRAGDAIGGHLLSGHIDGTATLQGRQERGECLRLVLEAPAGCAGLVAEKGSVALAGVSLTVAACRQGSFAVELVPQTIASTLLAQLRIGQAVNFEADMLARYADRAARAILRN